MKDRETDTDIGLIPSRLMNDRALVAIGSSLTRAGPCLTCCNVNDCQLSEIAEDTLVTWSVWANPLERVLPDPLGVERFTLSYSTRQISRKRRILTTAQVFR